MTLVVDVGTNAEIVLGNRDRLLAASSPTGPAFEGAQISGGQRAAPGAIERVRIDRDDARAALPGHRRRRSGPTRPGFATGVADELGITGICGSGIVEVIAELFLAGVITDGRRHRRRARRAHAAHRRRRPDVLLRPPRGRRIGRPAHHDHPERRPRDPARQGRAVRRRPAADGPARASTTVDEIRLAGAFGSQIDPLHAMVLGLIPDCDLAHVALGRATPPGPARSSRCCRPRRGARSRTSSGASRRSRPPSSRASRSTSSTRWRSRTGPPPSRTCRRS